MPMPQTQTRGPEKQEGDTLLRHTCLSMVTPHRDNRDDLPCWSSLASLYGYGLQVEIPATRTPDLSRLVSRYRNTRTTGTSEGQAWKKVGTCRKRFSGIVSRYQGQCWGTGGRMRRPVIHAISDSLSTFQLENAN